MDSLERARPGSARVFLSYALPATAGLVLTTVAVVADGLFVGRVIGAAGLAAVNLSLPLLYLFLAIGVMIGLDWLFILRLGMGMRGAALSSGLGAFAQAVLAAVLVLRGRCELKPARPRLSRAELASVLGNGSSELIGQLSVTVTVYLFNSVLMRRIGVAGVAAYKVAGYRAASRAWLGVAPRFALAVAAAAEGLPGRA